MIEDDHLNEIRLYVKKIYRWVVVIGVIIIFAMVFSFCGAMISTG